MAVIITTTKICHIQNPLSKQHLNGCHHYRFIVWSKSNIYVQEDSRRSLNSNKTLLKTNQPNETIYGLNQIPAWLKTKSPFSGTHFDDKFPTFGVISCIMVSAPIFAWLGFDKFLVQIILGILIRYQNNLTCWQLTPLHDMNIHSWMPILDLIVNENDLGVPVERHGFLKSHDNTLHASYHWHDEYHYEKLEHVMVMTGWSGNVTISRKTISELNHIT